MGTKRWSVVMLVIGLIACGDSTTSAPVDAAQDTRAPLTICETDAQCRDTSHCNGEETCEPNATNAGADGCVPGTAVVCNDDITCTLDRCDDATSACVFDAPDVDQDGHVAASCLDSEGDPMGDDCDDNDAQRYPGNTEVCDADHDEDCSGTTVGTRDDDNDQRIAISCCNVIDSVRTCGNDCNDGDPIVAPGMPELCDDRDNDCDDDIDEDPSDANWYLDADHDGFGDPDVTPQVDCAPIAGYVLNATDCADDNDQFHPGALEICDGQDNNCNDVVDDGVGCSLVDGGIEGGVLGCMPSTRRCNPDAPITPQLCVAWGAWENETPCAYVCQDGQCVGECTPSNQRCQDRVPQTCDPSGAWVSGSICPMACVNGECAGACVPGATMCSGRSVLTCNSQGQWPTNGSMCQYACNSGACGGVCVPGTQRCSDLTPQTCDASGQWVNGNTCANWCLDGSCVACEPATERCQGRRLQLCTSAGSWPTGTNCPYVCNATTAACDGVCLPNDRQCAGNTQRVCGSDGYWDDTQCPYVCNPGTETCDGVCVPNSTGCVPGSDTPRSCGSDGYWDNAAACGGGSPYCLSGVCSTPIVQGNNTMLPLTASSSASYVFARRVSVSSGRMATKLGIRMATAGVHVTLALYSDSSGPNTLLGRTNEGTTVVGALELNLQQEVALSTGTYWIAYIVDATASIEQANGGAQSPVHYQASPYNSFPNSFSSMGSPNVYSYGLYLVARP